MKFRQFLKNAFQNRIDRYQESFFHEMQGKDEQTQGLIGECSEHSLQDDHPWKTHFRSFADSSNTWAQEIAHRDGLSESADCSLKDDASRLLEAAPSTRDISTVNCNTEAKEGAISLSSDPLTLSQAVLDDGMDITHKKDSSAMTSVNQGQQRHGHKICYDGEQLREYRENTAVNAATDAAMKNPEAHEAPPYTSAPQQSRKYRRTAERKTAKKKAIGSLKLKIEKKAQIIRQLSALLDAGMDLRSSLAILKEQEARHENTWFFLHDLFVKIEAGNSLSEALTSSVVKFETSEIAMVRAGEAVGQQANTLAKMANLMEKKIFIKKKIISAMLYPATVFTVSSMVILLLTTFVVPRFEKVIAEQIGAHVMPTLTVIILDSSRFVTTHLKEILVTLLIMPLVILGAKKIAFLKKVFYAVVLKIPLLGDCIMKWDVVLFSRTFGDLLLCGCSVIESLKMASESINNCYMKANLALTIRDVQQGMSLTVALRRRNVFPVMAEGLIKVGEESGKLGAMMNRVALSYEEQLDELITRTTSMIEPVLVIFLAGFVGSVVIGLFLPLVTLIQNIAM
ncbi:MAG: type II secretion system F family protein [Puniceicoccales bacterium]|jgi:type IV pilus assembly protein PilC|nr:type II secretion system F family protein [Puniceicoccales bacterium]